VALSAEWLDSLRSRTTLSALIGKSVKLTKKGGEAQGCCPFHNEKTPSFTVSDVKGFYHCFGCGAHGDAIRWLIDAQGMAFMDAVKDLAAAAGMDVPAPSAEAARREGRVSSLAAVLDRAAGWFAKQLQAAPDVLAALEARGIAPASIDKFNLGFAPPKKGVVGCGAGMVDLAAAGLLVKDEASGVFRDFFRNRLMIPVHDARGRVVGFAGRIQGDGQPKYINSVESDVFHKGDLLFNLHRAAPAARSARRLIIVEGQLDAIALDQAGIAEAVAPMGTAVTERQLERAWRVAHCPVLLFDGDAAGRKAALRAAERAMPHVGPGRSLAIAQLADGEDPDSLIRAAAAPHANPAAAAQAGRDAIEAAVAAAVPLAEWLFQALLQAAA
jgi:DNA primase